MEKLPSGLRFEDARPSKLVPKVKRFRSGPKYRKYREHTHETRIPVMRRKSERRQILVYRGNVLLGRIMEVNPSEIKTHVYDRDGEGTWALQKAGEYSFTPPECAKRFCKSLLEARYTCADYFQSEKKAVEESWSRGERWTYEKDRKTKRIPLKALPFGSADEFYPTPRALAGRMLCKIAWKGRTKNGVQVKEVKTILEPSAGKGDLLAALVECSDSYDSILYDRYAKSIASRVDCIELDPNLQALLRGLGYRVVADDFLAFHTHKKYDAIIMNPPFSNGDAHLLKAIDLQEKTGGQIVCLLNAETIRNPNTQRRKELLEKLNYYDAKYEFVEDGFKKAERRTDVESVIVWLTVPEPPRYSNIVEQLKKAPQYSGEYSPTALMEKGDVVSELIQLYNFEADAVVSLLREYQGLLPYMEPSGYNSAIIRIAIGEHDRPTTEVDTGTINDALECLRETFWRKLLHDPRLEPMIGKMTEDMRREYDRNISDMRDRDFTEYNIKALLLDIQSQLCRGLEDSIMKLFKEMTAHALYDGCKNVHYYTGWKTNSGCKINNKVILPFYSAFNSYSYEDKDKLNAYKVSGYLSDMIKVMDFLDRGETTMPFDLIAEIAAANVGQGRRTVSTKYFTATFYKKGTVHIKFREEAQHVLDRFNIFAATHQKDMDKNWLPPYFGAVSYEDMDDEGKAVIDSYYSDIENPEQRHKEYEKVCRNPGYYLTTIDSASVPLLMPGD